MGTPFFILASGQSNIQGQSLLNWSPNPRAQIWNNDQESDSSVGSAFGPLQNTLCGIAPRYAHKVAEGDTTKDVYLLRCAKQGRDLPFWIGGAQFAYTGSLGDGTIAFNSTPATSTVMVLSAKDVYGIQRPYFTVNALPGETVWIKQGSIVYQYVITTVNPTLTSSTFGISLVSATGGTLSAGTMQVEFQPRMLLGIENAVPAALAAAGKSTIDVFLWWQGESDAEYNTRYEFEFEFVMSYLKAKPWWGVDTKMIICAVNSTANNGLPWQDPFNVRLANLANAAPNRYFANTPANVPSTDWADVFHMKGIGYADAGDYVFNSVYKPPVGGSTGTGTITSMSAGPASVIMDVTPNQAHQLIDGNRTAYGLWLDGPPHPYKDNTGAVYLTLKHSENYRFKIGSWATPSAWELQGPVMLSTRDTVEGHYNNRHWLYGHWSTGSTVYALTHHEWYLNMYTSAGVPGFNALNYSGGSARFNRQWVNGVGLATSTNGGRNFTIAPNDNSTRLVVVPEPWAVQSADHMYGFFHPSNIVQEGGYYYAAIEQRSVVNAAAKNSICGVSLIRTTNLTSTLNWEYWSGSNWVTIDHGIYQGNLSSQAPHRFFEQTNDFYTSSSTNSNLGQNLRYHTPTSQWLMFGYAGTTAQVLGYSSSPTLVNPQFNTVTGIPNPNPGVFYPYLSVFDEAASDLNYQNIGNNLTVLSIDGSVSKISRSYLTITVNQGVTSTYSIFPSITGVNEGSTVTFNVATTNVADGTVLYWTNSGTTSAADFSDGQVSGSFVVYGNSGSFNRTLSNDSVTEGNETVIMQVRTGSTSGAVVATSSTVTVYDTSVPSTPTYSIVPSLTSVNEGSTVTFNVATTNVANGTLYWTNAGTTVGADFTDNANSGSFALSSNSGSISRSLTNDLLAEGTETIVIQIRTGSTSGTVVATATTVNVFDTSAPTTVTYAITPSTSQINEGSTVTFNVVTTNVADGTVLYWTNSGTTSAGDFSDNQNSGAITISSNTGSISRTASADSVTEGSETIILSLRTGSTAGTVVANASTVTVLDSSTTPSATSRLRFRNAAGTGWLNAESVAGLRYRNADGTGWLVKTATLTKVGVRNAPNTGWINFTGAVTSYSVSPSATLINEGTSVSFLVSTSNVADGTTLYWTNAGSSSASDFTDGVNSGTLTISGSSGNVNRTVLNDGLTEGNETIVLQIRTGSISGPVVATSITVVISDTSVPSVPTALTMNRNNLDFLYTPVQVSTDPNGYLDLRATITTTNFFSKALDAFDHVVFAFDCAGAQGSSNPHCGPIIRNGSNLFATARGFFITRGSGVYQEEWNGTSSPVVLPVTNTSGATFNPVSGTYAVRIKAGYPTSSLYTNLMTITITRDSLYGEVVFQGSMSGRNFPNSGSSYAMMGCIAAGFIGASPSNGCTEPSGPGSAYGGYLPFSDFNLYQF